MTEAGVAWQQYDLSDSDADDADVKRGQAELVGFIPPHIFLEPGSWRSWILEINWKWWALQKICPIKNECLGYVLAVFVC